jgi:hypothetical protein
VATIDVDAAIREGKLAPEQREAALAAAQLNPVSFRRAMSAAPRIFDPISAGTEERVAAVEKFQAKVIEKLKADKDLAVAEAQAQVSSEEPELYRAAYGR